MHQLPLINQHSTKECQLLLVLLKLKMHQLPLINQHSTKECQLLQD
jgi:hypothetical protein